MSNRTKQMNGMAGATRPMAQSNALGNKMISGFMGLNLGGAEYHQPQHHQYQQASPQHHLLHSQRASHNSFGGQQEYEDTNFSLGGSTIDQEELFEQLGLEIQRATSAPPAMELASNNIFSFQSKYSHLFGDIRCDDSYESFYNSYGDKSKLPPPLAQDPLFNWSGGQKEKQPSPIAQHAPPFGKPMPIAPQPIQPQQVLPKRPVPPRMSFPIQRQHPNNAYLFEDMSPVSDGMQGSRVTMQDLEKAAAAITGSQDDMSPQVFAPPQEYTITVSKSQKPSQVATVAPPQRQPSPKISPQPSPNMASQKAPSYSAVAATKPAPVKQPVPNPTTSPGPLSDTSSEDSLSPKLSSKEAKQKPFKYQEVSEVIGKIYSLAKDQHGCRFLQKKLEEKNAQDTQAIFSEVYEHIVELMTDPFGNYLCQKLVEFCNDKQKTAIITAVAPALVRISMNMHGTRAVQKLIECLNTPNQVSKIIEALRSSVVPLIKDLNGNHVIQRCLQKMAHSDKQFIYDAVAGRCVEVATHKHGCCVLQRCLDYASEDQKMLLIREVTANALTLVQNAFGNYVVQYVLDLGVEEVNSNIIQRFLGNICSLSQNKFSSNVIEKCLRIANAKVRNQVIEETLLDDTIVQLLQDSYGNYVLQTAMTICDNRQFIIYHDTIRPLLHLVRNTPYGKKIENKLNKRPLQPPNGTTSPSVSPPPVAAATTTTAPQQQQPSPQSSSKSKGSGARSKKK